MTAAELRAQHLEDALTRLVECLETVFVGVDAGMLRDLAIPDVITDYAEACERAPFEADTQEHVLPVGIRGESAG